MTDGQTDGRTQGHGLLASTAVKIEGVVCVECIAQKCTALEREAV